MRQARQNFIRHRQVMNRAPKKRASFSNTEIFINKAQAVEQEETYTNTHTFADFRFDQQLQLNIEKRGYQLPSPIQDQAIKPALAGQDVLGIANTGTGKTAAFLLPLIQKMLNNRQQKLLIIAPTRELAVQIEEEFRAFTPQLSLYSVLCIGGASMNVQAKQLRRGYNAIIATPGRLKDFMQQRAIDLSRFQNVVLDEVDQMFDMGFVKDIQYILSQLPPVRQSLFFSATLSKEVDALVKEQLKNPAIISLKKRDTAATVDQDVVRITQNQNKLDVLHELLIQEGFDKVLIFGRTKHGVDKLSFQLLKRGFKADAIHGNKSQNARQHALRKLKQDQINILVATDVAARGLDIPDVTHVINYDLPETYEDYIHRIGRTGRANKSGKALTFIEH